MTTLLGVTVNDHGQPLWVPNDRQAQLAFYRVFFETDVGRQLEPFVAAEKDKGMMTRIQQIHRKWYGDTAEVTLDSFTNVVQQLLATHDPAIVPPEPIVEPEKPDETPRDKNGNPLSPSQLAWKEHGKYAETHSVNECHVRARNDASFRKFMESSYQREMNEKPVDSGIILSERQPDVPRVKVTPALIQFAERYQKTQVSEIRRLMSAANLNHREFAKNVDDAMAAGLI